MLLAGILEWCFCLDRIKRKRRKKEKKNKNLYFIIRNFLAVSFSSPAQFLGSLLDVVIVEWSGLTNRA
jgi:hypothetical protein